MFGEEIDDDSCAFERSQAASSMYSMTSSIASYEIRKGMKDAIRYERHRRTTNEGKTQEEKEGQLREAFGTPVKRRDRMLHITEEGIDQLRHSIARSERENAMQRLDAVQQQMTQFHSLLDKLEELEASKEELAKSLIASRLELADSKSQNDHQKLALMRCEMDLKLAKAENAMLRKDNDRNENLSRQRRSQASRGERLSQSLRCGTRPNLITALLDKSLRSEIDEGTSSGDRRNMHSSSMTAMEAGRHEGFWGLTEEKSTDLDDQLRLDLLDIDDGGVDWGTPTTSITHRVPKRTPLPHHGNSRLSKAGDLTAKYFTT